MRSLIWKMLWGLAFHIWVPRFTVEGRIPQGPVVFAANHCSHADTAALQLALARLGHTRVLAAGAEDYFFRTKTTGSLSRLIGVFPFPRKGSVGLKRAIRILGSGTSVILYPAGSRDGGAFKPGVSYLAAAGFTVVPVTIDGTNRLLPKGRSWPMRSDVHLRFGTPVGVRTSETPREFASRLERAVRSTTRRSAA
jgi:1-acyl-sn-glycerol-3-phosphate acyltransferase